MTRVLVLCAATFLVPSPPPAGEREQERAVPHVCIASDVGRALPAIERPGGQCPPYAKGVAFPGSTPRNPDPATSSEINRRVVVLVHHCVSVGEYAHPTEATALDVGRDLSRRRVSGGINPALRNAFWAGRTTTNAHCQFAVSLAAAAAATSPTTAPAKQFKTKDGKILPSMEELAKLTGDPKAGAAVFRNAKTVNCIKCHQIGDEGQMIGPPLTVVGSKLTKLQLYEAILYPSNAIEMGYEAYVVRCKTGDVYAGLKVEDTPDRITIKDTDGKYHDIDRDHIDKMVQQKISLMPEGLNEAVTQQELVNLVEYLSTLKS